MNRVILIRRPITTPSMQRELEELFRRQYGQPRASDVRHEDGLWQPQVDVYEVDDAFVVLAELAGMRDQPIEVTLTDDALLIVGRRPELHREGTQRFHQLEVNEGPFQATILLPGPVAEEGISAHYDDGLLTITLPKHKPHVRRIEVSTSQE